MDAGERARTVRSSSSTSLHWALLYSALSAPLAEAPPESLGAPPLPPGPAPNSASPAGAPASPASRIQSGRQLHGRESCAHRGAPWQR